MDLPRLYAILDVDVLSTRGLHALDVVEAWLTAGVRLVQLRAKQMDGGPFLELADQMQARIQRAGGRLIINDRADIARMSDADGVHVGQTDLTPQDVRRALGPTFRVGVSTHTPAQVDAACASPVDYVAIGPVFATTTKGAQVDPEVGLAGVSDAAVRASRARLPLVAIGGITRDRAAAVIAAGASAVAVIADLTGPDAGLRARAFLRALEADDGP